MRTRMTVGMWCCAGLAFGLGGVGHALGADRPEVEPNDSKAAATPVTLALGDTLSGATTSGTGAGFDYFRVRTTNQARAIYLHSLSLPSTQPFALTLRGLDQIDRAIQTNTDFTFATALNSGAAGSPKVLKWYGFGKGEQVFVRVAGTSATTDPYAATLETATVTPIELGNVDAGPIRVQVNSAADSGYDTDWIVYDGRFNPVSTFSHDDVDATGITRTLPSGRYYIAAGRFNTANNQPVPADDTYTGPLVLDFPSLVACSDATSDADAYGLTVTNTATTQAISGSWTAGVGPFEIAWFTFSVGDGVVGVAGTGSASPPSQGAGATVIFRVAAEGGFNPDSTGLGVRIDLSGIGGAASQPMFDDGTNGDDTPGDGVFFFAFPVPAGTSIGTRAIPFTVSDAQARSASATISFAVRAPGTFAEVEPNDSKGMATLVNGYSPGQPIGGSSTGGTGSGAGSADYFRIKMAPANPGVYRNTISVAAGGPHPDGTIRGRSQSGAGVIDAASDVELQAGIGATTSPDSNVFYSFGKEEEFYYRVAGTASTTTPYEVTILRESAPIDQLDPIADAGTYSIRATSSDDTELWVYNADTLEPIPGFNNDDSLETGSGLACRLTRSFPAGRYLIAIARFNLANNLQSPADESFRGENVCDFPNMLVESNSATGINVAFDIRQGSSTGPIARSYTSATTRPFEVKWVGVNIGAPACIADVDNGSGTGTPDGGVTIEDLLFYLVVFGDGNVRADVDNGTGTGTPDGGVTIEDLLYFLLRFEQGC